MLDLEWSKSSTSQNQCPKPRMVSKWPLASFRQIPHRLFLNKFHIIRGPPGTIRGFRRNSTSAIVDQIPYHSRSRRLFEVAGTIRGFRRPFEVPGDHSRFPETIQSPPMNNSRSPHRPFEVRCGICCGVPFQSIRGPVEIFPDHSRSDVEFDFFSGFG